MRIYFFISCYYCILDDQDHLNVEQHKALKSVRSYISQTSHSTNAIKRKKITQF